MSFGSEALAQASVYGSSANGTEQAALEEQVLEIIRTHPEVLLESIQTYQQQQFKQQLQARQAFLQEMKVNPQGVVDASPKIGAAAQEIVLLEFGDFQCPYCGEVQGALKQFMEQHQDEVTLVYKFLPLGFIHPEALSAAKAAWAANQQGKFWPYQDALFAQQDQLGESRYEEIAKTLNLNLTRFNQDRQSSAASAAIQQDLEMAKMLGARGTPFFVLNGEPLRGNVELSTLESVLARVNRKDG